MESIVTDILIRTPDYDGIPVDPYSNAETGWRRPGRPAIAGCQLRSKAGSGGPASCRFDINISCSYAKIVPLGSDGEGISTDGDVAAEEVTVFAIRGGQLSGELRSSGPAATRPDIDVGRSLIRAASYVVAKCTCDEGIATDLD